MRYREHLIRLALDGSTHPRYAHAAVIAKGRSILGKGSNGSGVHAEVRALRSAAGADVSGSTCYTLMVKRRTGKVGDGSPCPSCMATLAKAGIRRVVVYIA